jgi:uncharacterized phiE125 gp8 family phage protein
MINGTIDTVDRPVSFTMSGSSPDERIEPVTLTLVKKHLRFLVDTEDEIIEEYIAAARTFFEEQTGRQTVNATYEFTLDRFPVGRRIVLPRPPLREVLSVTYDDEAGDPQTLGADQYRVQPSLIVDPSPVAGAIDPYCAAGSIELVAGASWPGTADQAQAVRIRRVCGYGETAALMPAMVRQILYFMVGHFHRNRAEVSDEALTQIPLGAAAMLQPFLLTFAPFGLQPPTW